MTRLAPSFDRHKPVHLVQPVKHDIDLGARVRRSVRPNRCFIVIHFGRMLIAQAIVGGLAIVTPDPLISQYPIRVIW